jgi:hypothetical protein
MYHDNTSLKLHGFHFINCCPCFYWYRCKKNHYICFKICKLDRGKHHPCEHLWSISPTNITVYSLFSATSSINGILEKLGQKEGGAAMTLDQITQVLEELQCTTSTDDPEAFTFGKICFKCSVFFFLCCVHKSYAWKFCWQSAWHGVSSSSQIWSALYGCKSTLPLGDCYQKKLVLARSVSCFEMW